MEVEQKGSKTLIRDEATYFSFKRGELSSVRVIRETFCLDAHPQVK